MHVVGSESFNDVLPTSSSPWRDIAWTVTIAQSTRRPLTSLSDILQSKVAHGSRRR